MKPFAMTVLPLALAAVLAACGAPAPESVSPEVSGAEEASSSEAAKEAVPPPPVPLESLEWKSDRVVLTLEPEKYEAGPDNLPVGFSLPKEAEEFFLTGYPGEFAPEVLPLMRYDIAAGDVNGDGETDCIVSALPQVMYFGNNPPPAYLFCSQPDGGYRRAAFSTAQDAYRLLDTSANGLPDLLYGNSGCWLSFNGTDAYETAPGSPEAGGFRLLTSKPEIDGGALRVPVHPNYGLPDNCYIAAYFPSEADRLESPLAWLTMPDGSYAYTGGEAFHPWDCAADLRLRPGASLGEDEYLFPDEIQFVPAG